MTFAHDISSDEQYCKRLVGWDIYKTLYIQYGSTNQLETWQNLGIAKNVQLEEAIIEIQYIAHAKIPWNIYVLTL